ncbi:D-alanine--D-alanine ligase family protein [Silvibacterium dinghuense]|uniref:D-alanine--D-alanine ligase n=1 Tax=Silvibacterium dinghuense TaxID=1560006 RepID=A0A4V1NUX8_9BACT|nr:D-alanine--D-alanine ligase family protein [Silvibacterium dinghuense]RXS93804.1 D-alanine--D-alanine ligase [Silvibacterium dinghuense]
MKKLRVGVLFGGRSGEHEVSLLSAASVLKAINRKKYEVVPIGITKAGRWVTASDAERLLNGSTAEPAKQLPASNLRAGDPESTTAAAVLARVESVIVPPVPSQGKSSTLIPFETEAKPLELQATAAQGSVLNLDVILPVLHGTFGEDGTIQGLFELADIAYVGSGVLGSAAGMDKDVMKKLFAAAKLPMVRHVSFLRADWESKPKKVIAQVEAALKYPLFVKPANLGSSVGISKVHDRTELAPAIDLAASFDRKIVIEQGVGGKRGKARELEVAVLGNDTPEASVVGEIVPGKEFYDYEAKYLAEGSYPVIPAKITKTQSRQIREMAIAAFRACDCSGLARVDFLMDPVTSKSPKIYLNEINTLPGFTSISMYPKLWDASGLKYPDLIDRLIALALERRAEKQRTQYSR